MTKVFVMMAVTREWHKQRKPKEREKNDYHRFAVFVQFLSIFHLVCCSLLLLLFFPFFLYSFPACRARRLHQRTNGPWWIRYYFLLLRLQYNYYTRLSLLSVQFKNFSTEPTIPNSSTKHHVEIVFNVKCYFTSWKGVDLWNVQKQPSLSHILLRKRDK